MSLQKNNNLYIIIQSIIYILGFSLVIFFAGTGLAQHDNTVGEFIIVFTYMGMALNNTNLILSFGQTYQNANASYNRIKELYEIQLQENGTVTVSEVHLINAEEISYIFENGRGLEKMSASFQKGKKVSY